MEAARPHPAPETDRLAELVNIGAGHAAGALAGLLGGTFVMRVPRVVRTAPGAASGGGRQSGVRFALDGALGGSVAWLLAPEARAELLRRMLGREEAALSPAQAESALQEAANIVISHLASAMGDALGGVLMPSPPSLVRDAGQLAAASAGLRIEVELAERGGPLESTLVFVPAGGPGRR